MFSCGSQRRWDSVSTIAQTNLLLKLTRIPDGATARKRHLHTTTEPVRTSCAVQEDDHGYQTHDSGSDGSSLDG